MNNKYKRVKKAANGLQDIAVPEQGSASNVLSSATSMASAGSQFGPWGALAGGAYGLATGLFQKNEQDEANRAAIKRNAFLKSNRGVAGVDSSVDQRGQYKKGTKMIEIEGKGTPEIHTDKNFNIKNLGTTPHSKGGNKVEASEGDIVFNTQNSLTKYNKIATAIQNGDKSTLKKEQNKLPEDTTPKMQQGVRGTKRPEPDYMMQEQEREAKGIPARRVYKTGGIDRRAERLANQEMKPVESTPNIKPLSVVKPTTAPSTRAVGTRQYDGPVRDIMPKGLSTYLKNKAVDDFDKSEAEYKRQTGKASGLIRPTGAGSVKAPTLASLPATSMSDFFKGGTKIPVAKSATTTKPKSAVGKQGKYITGKTTPIAKPILPKLVTDFGKADTGDGSDLRDPAKPFVFDDSDKEASVKTVGEGVKGAGSIPGASSSTTANNIMQMAGVANNLFQGMKSETKTPETYFNPELLKYQDRSQNLRNQSANAAAIQGANARNVSGGSASNIRANQNQAALSNLGRQNAIDEQEMTRRDAIEAQNTGLKNQAGQYNLQRKDMYEGQYKADRLRKQDYIDTAAADIGQLGMARQEEAYLRSRDDKAEAAQMAGYKSINGRYQHKSTLEGDTYFEPDADSATTRYGLPKLASTFGTPTTKRGRKPGNVGFAKGTKSVNTSKYKMK